MTVQKQLVDTIARTPPDKLKVLLTGGLGYIGSHTAVVLTELGYQVLLYDNLSNSRVSVLDHIKSITGKSLIFIEGDVRDTQQLEQVLTVHNIDAVIHFAGLKAVGESVEKPIDYYDNNVNGIISLLKAMHVSNIKILVFSSSATVYGDPQYLPLNEEHPTGAKNPYGRSKLQIEEILADIAKSDPDWRITCLRYFNPIGAHDSGLLGEDPSDVPNNLMPYIARVGSGKLPHLNIFGNDYNTKDGTGVRDYIHVMDLAEGHTAALSFLIQNTGWHAFNLGTGNGYSVLDLVEAFEKSSGRSIHCRITNRRPGDIASSYANSEKAVAQLGWKPTRTISDMCNSTWLLYTKAENTQ